MGVLWYLAAAFLPSALTPLFGADLTPEIEGWPHPTLLILGGLLLGIVLGLISAAFGGVIGAGVKARTRRALRKEIAATSQELIVGPLTALRSSYGVFLDDIHAAAR